MSPIVEKTIKQLKKSNLTLEDRTALLTAIYDKLAVLPLNDSITVDGQDITINGKSLELEQIILLKQACLALQDNFARKLIHEQVRYLATNLGVYQSTSLDQLYFFKSALWNLNQENKLIERLLSFAVETNL